MIRLDTHVVVWLYTGEVERLSESAVDALERHVPVVSPIVQLELTSLHEIDRLMVSGTEVIDDLRERIGMQLSDTPLGSIVTAAAPLSWTRDPFDRLIVADALVASADLITKDATIAANCPLTLW